RTAHQGRLALVDETLVAQALDDVFCPALVDVLADLLGQHPQQLSAAAAAGDPDDPDVPAAAPPALDDVSALGREAGINDVGNLRRHAAELLSQFGALDGDGAVGAAIDHGADVLLNDVDQRPHRPLWSLLRFDV